MVNLAIKTTIKTIKIADSVLDLEEQKAELTRQQNEYKILLKSLEDDLLMRLSSAGDNILSDSALVENLEFTKKTAADIEIKVKI